MTSKADAERFRVLYDVERHVMATDGGILVEDPYPAFAELRARAPVHRGSVRELLGYPPGGLSLRGDAPVYSAFSFEANDIVLRENQVFSSAYYSGSVTPLFGARTILEMVGEEHRRYRALVQPAFSPKRAQWWIDKWIASLVDEAIGAFERHGRAELNAELCSRIPLQTITSSFGLSRQEALDFRQDAEGGGMGGADPAAARERHERATAMLRRVIEDRRARPQDDVITMLVESEIEEDGQRHLLTDDEIFGFSRLILTAGSGTTWRQLGILLVALLKEPALLDAVRQDRQLLRRAIEEAVRWEPTDPIFRRLTTRDVTLCGVDIPAGAVVEMNLGAANRDPARWEDPERFDPFRDLKPNLGFAGGPHICLGMHVARAEMWVAMNAVLDRLANLRLDPEVPDVRIIGLEHRGPNGIPVLFDPPTEARSIGGVP
ncbi:MAG TPA: cytochrome P450 [Acidimicrobiales bacterium]|nr:cytochrome P450 [Acidimicrobiales bacterium]